MNINIAQPQVAQVGLQVTNPSPPSPEPPSRAFTIATTRIAPPRDRSLIPAEVPHPDQTIKVALLRSECYLSWGSPNLALQQAEVGLYLATKHELYNLEAKSQYYRAKCLMETERWEEARWALARAASVRDFEGEIEWFGDLCEAHIEIDAWNVEYEKHLRAEVARIEREERGN